MLNFDVTTVDVDPEVKADVYAHVMDMPFGQNSFDTVLCCQVLEHLPFRDFTKALKIFKRLSRKSAVISLPDVSRHIDFYINLPKVGKIHKSFHYARTKDARSRMRKMGHYWEIGCKDTDLDTIAKSIKESGWHIMKTWRVPEIPWHRFFVLRHEGVNEMLRTTLPQ